MKKETWGRIAFGLYIGPLICLIAYVPFGVRFGYLPARLFFWAEMAGIALARFISWKKLRDK